MDKKRKFRYIPFLAKETQSQKKHQNKITYKCRTPRRLQRHDCLLTRSATNSSASDATSLWLAARKRSGLGQTVARACSCHVIRSLLFDATKLIEDAICRWFLCLEKQLCTTGCSNARAPVNPGQQTRHSTAQTDAACDPEYCFDACFLGKKAVVASFLIVRFGCFSFAPSVCLKYFLLVLIGNQKGRGRKSNGFIRSTRDGRICNPPTRQYT